MLKIIISMKFFRLSFSVLFVFSSANPIGDKLEKGTLYECDNMNFRDPESKSIGAEKLVDCLFMNHENQTNVMNITSKVYKNDLKNLIDFMGFVKDLVCNVTYIEKIEKTIGASNIPDIGKDPIRILLEFVKKSCSLYESNNIKRMILMMTKEEKYHINKREVEFNVTSPLIPIKFRFLISTVFNFVREIIKNQHNMFPSLLQENKEGKTMAIISSLNMSKLIKDDVLKYIWEIRKSNIEAENLLLDCSKNITNKLVPSIFYLSINNVFRESVFFPLGYNDSVETNLLGWMMGRNDLSENSVQVILNLHDFLHNFAEKLNLDLFLDELENIYLKSLNDNNYSVCSAYAKIEKSLHTLLDPILQNSTEKVIGNRTVNELEKRGRVDTRMKRNSEELDSLSRKLMTNKEWNAKKEEFFKKYSIFEAEVSDTNSTNDVKENVERILEGFSIESGEGDRPTTLKMSKKWKPVAERIKRASGENQTSALTGSMDEEDEERLSLSQDEKILLEEALDHIISSIINHRNDMMSKTRKFISLVVHILAKSDQMEPESLSCIARAGVTFMAETRKHLNTVFKGFRTELETMKKNLWSEDSVDGSDKDETITKLISTELMRDVADAIAASTRTYEVNKVRLFEKFMLCKEKNSA